ncbi:MAG: hypothetical protein AAF845_06760 [Bacteroidota bacterium]
MSDSVDYDEECRRIADEFSTLRSEKTGGDVLVCGGFAKDGRPGETTLYLPRVFAEGESLRFVVTGFFGPDESLVVERPEGFAETPRGFQIERASRVRGPGFDYHISGDVVSHARGFRTLSGGPVLEVRNPPQGEESLVGRRILSNPVKAEQGVWARLSIALQEWRAARLDVPFPLGRG